MKEWVLASLLVGGIIGAIVIPDVIKEYRQQKALEEFTEFIKEEIKNPSVMPVPRIEIKPKTQRPQQWITIEPKSREVCIAESRGVLDRQYMRCRSGWQELVTYDERGRKAVIKERAIPAY